MASASIESVSSDGPVCPICLDIFISPRQLPCMHTFCQKCLHDYISKTIDINEEFGKEFVCPVCRAITNPPKTDKPAGEWAALYPRSPISVTEGSKVKVERYCNGCQYAGESNTALGFCVVCEESLCNSCLTAHKRTKSTRDHKAISIEELNSTPENQIRFAEGFGCPGHQDNHLEYYCQSHEVVCCADCFFSDHRTCDHVKSLSKDLPSLLNDLRPEEIMEQMQRIEKHLQTFTVMNESNISKLETTINNLTAEIRAIRKKVDERLDEIERMVTTEGKRIYKEEMILRDEENHQCQCLINAVRNSHTFLKSVLKYGTDTQKFLVYKKSMSQLKSYTVQIREKYEEIELVKVQLDLNVLVNEILSPDLGTIARLQCKGDRKSFLCYGISESLVSSSTRKPLQESQVKLDNVVDIQYPGINIPFYSGAIQLPAGDIVVVDRENRTCNLHDSAYSFITSSTLPSEPRSMCLLHDHEIAVTLPDLRTVQFLAIRDSSIRNTGVMKTRCQCFGVAAISREEVVVSGPTDDLKKCYWSLISKTAGERYLHEFDCAGVVTAHVALNNSKSCIYISVASSNSVYCFGLTDGIQYFVYTSNDLQGPLGIAVDKEDSVYVVGGYSHNIHKLSPDGTTLQVITSGVPQCPVRIFIDENRERFIVTNNSDNQRKKLHLFV